VIPPESTTVAAAFDRKAQIYDEFGRDHPNLARMRQKVYTAVRSGLSPGAHILEINAGSGIDAAALAQQGYHIHATDIAPAMVAAIRQKIESLDLAATLTAQQCSFTALEQVFRPGAAGLRFDGLLSSMGGVNCLSDLTQITRQLPVLLNPGAIVVWVVLPPLCLWELLAIGRDPKVALRRWQRHGALANIEGISVPTYYYTPRQVERAFGPDFHRLSLAGLSVFTPPADHKTFPSHHPRLYRWLCRLDERCSDWPIINQCGDFFIITLQYCPQVTMP
jgi:hypothetical protein